MRIGKNNEAMESKTVIDTTGYNYGIDFTKLMPKFNVKENDVVLYLSIFERQAKRVCVDPKYWVSSLLALLPSYIIQLLVREAEEKFEDYDYIKGISLKR